MSEFPAWFYGPNGEARIFAAADDVPEGWRDSPAAFYGAALARFDASEHPSAEEIAERLHAPPKRGPGRPRKDAD